MRLETFDGIRRVGNEDVKSLRRDIFVGIIFESVTEFNFAFVRAVHEQRNFRDAGKSVVLFHAEKFIAFPHDGRRQIFSFVTIIDSLKTFREEMPRAASVIDNFRRRIKNNFVERQAVPNKSRNRQRRKKLSFVLLEALIKQLFKQISERLQIFRADNFIILQDVDDFGEDFRVDIEKFFVVHVDKGKGVVVEELQLAIIIFEGGR